MLQDKDDASDGAARDGAETSRAERVADVLDLTRRRREEHRPEGDDAPEQAKRPAPKPVETQPEDQPDEQGNPDEGGPEDETEPRVASRPAASASLFQLWRPSTAERRSRVT